MEPEAAAELLLSSDKTLMTEELLHVDKQKKSLLEMDSPPGEGDVIIVETVTAWC